MRVTGRLSRSDLLWVANTAHGPGGHWHARVRGGGPDHDHLELPEPAMRYLADHGVPVPRELPDPVALAELGVVRTMVGRLLAPGIDTWTVEGRVLLAAASYALDDEGRITSTETGWRGFCRDPLVPLLALVEDRASLRRCANPACRLLFEDGSRTTRDGGATQRVAATAIASAGHAAGLRSRRSPTWTPSVQPMNGLPRRRTTSRRRLAGMRRNDGWRGVRRLGAAVASGRPPVASTPGRAPRRPRQLRHRRKAAPST